MRPADQAESERKRPSDQPSAQRERKREDRPIGADGPERGQKPSRRVAEAVFARVGRKASRRCAQSERNKDEAREETSPAGITRGGFPRPKKFSGKM